ncbi:hypothetical protein Hdeb2414_s0008g00278571 [Helianthus debilis subsp. tardiflorus]
MFVWFFLLVFSFFTEDLKYCTFICSLSYAITILSAFVALRVLVLLMLSFYAFVFSVILSHAVWIFTVSYSVYDAMLRRLFFDAYVFSCVSSLHCCVVRLGVLLLFGRSALPSC